MRVNQRPKWARGLSAREWNHLRDGQGKPPSLRTLVLDVRAGQCPYCRLILNQLGRSGSLSLRRLVARECRAAGMPVPPDGHGSYDVIEEPYTQAYY